MNQGSFYWNLSTLSHLCWSTNCTSRWVLVDRFFRFFHQTPLAISEPVLFLNLPFKLIFILSDLWFVLWSGRWEEPERQVWRSLQVNCDAAIRHQEARVCFDEESFWKSCIFCESNVRKLHLDEILRCLRTSFDRITVYCWNMPSVALAKGWASAVLVAAAPLLSSFPSPLILKQEKESK